MRVQHDETQTNRNIRITNDDGVSVMPKRGAAHILWKMSLDEWRQFQDGDLTPDELKQRYSGVSTEQTGISDYSAGDAE